MAIKTRYHIKNKQNTYDAVHFETSADQVIVSDQKQFVSAQEKNTWNNKADVSFVNQEVAKKADTAHSHSEYAKATHDHSQYALTNGDSLQDFNAKKLIVSDSILPSKTGLNIGSTTQRFSGIYVDEAYLSTNTLYIGDTPILGTNQDTIMIKADPDQSITMQTKNSGTTKILSETGVELAASGTNTNVNIKAIGANSQVNIAAGNVLNVSASDIKMNGDVHISGAATTNDLTVKGNLNVLGATTTIDTQTLQVKDNIIDINKGETGSGVTAGKAGIRVLRGDAATYNILFDETDDMFKVGMDGQLETIATQPYVSQELTKKANTVHTHQASQVTFTDGKTFQEKLNDGSLKGPKGDTGAQGPTGPQGATGAKGSTGVSMRLKGAWSSSVAYVNDSNYIDLVTSGGNTYACKVSNTNQAVSNTTYWELIAQKGDKGATGATGPQGAKGDTGAQGPQGIQGPQGATGEKGADGLTTSVTVGSTKYTHSNGNITLPAYPTLSSLGAAAASHSHSYLPLSGGTVTGDLIVTGSMISRCGTTDVSLNFINDVPCVRYGGNGTGATNGFNIVGVNNDVKMRVDESGEIYAKGTQKVYHIGNKPSLTELGAASTAVATTSANGLLSSTDKTKLDGIATGANKTILNNTVTSTSTTEAATANAVKMAYDKANHSHNYLSLSGGTITNSSFGPLIIHRSGSTNGASIAFSNDNGTLGYIGMTASANGGLVRWNTDTSISYNILDSGNYKTFVTPANIGAAAASHGTHVSYSTTAPLANGTASAGSASTVARTDHVHPLQTSVSGNAGTATKLQTARTIALTGSVTGSGTFDGSGNLSITTTTNHTHNYAGSSSAGGAATSALACTGNSATATKWATARTITLSGAVTGSASIDGSNNVTITTSDARPVTTITKSLAVTTSWMDTGIAGSNLSTGSYMVQMLVNDGTNTSQYQEYYTGVMSWFADGTNSTDSDEILLHKAGHASNGRMVYLRTIRSASGGYLKLQIACSTAFAAASSITFKFRRLI